MSVHYKYGGSTASRTINCPGWRALSDTLNIEDKGSADADRGSMLHECCEILELEGLNYAELLERGVKFNDAELTEDLLHEKVIPAMEALDDLADTYNLGSITPEELIEFDCLIGGTIDIVGEAVGTLVFADYKFGDGIMVYADDNSQLLFYAWVKIADDEVGFKQSLKEVDKVVLAIIQPAERREETLDVFETTIDHVLDFGEKFLDAVDIAEESKPGENLSTGSHCQFCPAAKHWGDCPKKVEESNKDMMALKTLGTKGVSNTELVIPDIDDFSDMTLNQALEISKRLEPWIKSVRAFACSQLELGEDVPGWKLVQKRATKKWDDPAHAAAYLKRKLTAKNAMVSVPISPAQAVKMGKKLDIKLRLDKLINATSSGTVLAPESDSREAVLSQKAIADTLKSIENKDD